MGERILPQGYQGEGKGAPEFRVLKKQPDDSPEEREERRNAQILALSQE